MEKKLLPIGTVVQLEGKTRKVMITGYKSKMADSDRVYDYNGILFPDGLMINRYGLFDDSDIAEVFYEGYRDEKYDHYIDSLNDVKVGRVISEDGVKADGPGRRRRIPKEPTKPLSNSEMRARFTTQVISGGETEVFDFSSLENK